MCQDDRIGWDWGGSAGQRGMCMSRITAIALGSSVVAVVALSACGSSSSGSAPSSSAPASQAPASSSTATTTAAPPAPTATRLAAITLQPADLPAGWAGAPYQADPTAAASQAALASCLGIANTDLDKAAEAHSQDFSQGDAQISSQAESYKSPGDVQIDVKSLSSPKADSCFEQAARSSATAQGLTVSNVTVKVTPGPVNGISNVAGTANMTATVTESGNTGQFVTKAVFITGPDIEAEIDFTNIDGPLPSEAVQNALIAKVAGRASSG